MFLPYMGVVAILGHVTNTIFPCIRLEACVQNLVKNGPVVSEKSKF